MAKLLKHFGLGTPKKCNYEATSAELKESDVNLKQSVTNVDLACNEVPGSSAVSKVGKTSKSRNNSSASVDSSASVNINRTESLRSVVQTRKISRAEEAEMLAYSRSPTPAGSSPDIRGTKKHQEFHKKAIRKHKVKIPVTVPNKHLGITSDKIVLVQDEYSDPADFHLPYRQQSCASSVSDIDVFEPRLSDPVLAASEHLTVEESRLPIVDDDYCEPFEAQLPFLQENLNCEEPPVDDFEVFNEGAYDEVYETNDVVNDAFVAATDSDGELELPVPNSVANTDTRPGEEYDEPWEWGCPKQNQLMHLRPGGQVKTSISRSNSVARNSEAGSLVDNDPEPTEDVEAMTGRQRHIYETAFDSTVKADNDNDMEIVNHPILMRNEILPEGGVASSSKSSTPKGTPGGTPNLVSRVVSSRDAGIHEGDYTPKERRKVTLIRDSLRGRGGGSGSALMGDSTSSSSTSSPSSSSSKSSAAQHRTEHRVQAIVHLPPRSANSTPTLSYRAKEGLDSCASSAKSTPTHFLSSKTQHQHHLPVRQLSDLTLGENKNMSLNKSTTSMPLTTVGRSGGIHCDRRLPNTGTVSSEESVASTSSSSSSSNNNSRGSRGSVDNHRELKLVQALHAENQKASGKFSQLQKQFHELQMDRNHKPTSLSGDGVDTTTDTRPSEDYDPPWDCPKLTKRPVFSDNNSDVLVKLKFSRPSLGELTSSVEQTSTEVEKPGESTDQTWASKEIPLEPCNMTTTPDFQLPLKPESSAPSRSNLCLNLSCQSPKRKRNNLQLNFGCSALTAVGDTVDPTIPLDRQGWYHGAITRTEAENLLRLLQEGYYLVRNSESSKQDYSLSLKSARGFMHMKIVYSEGKYILGQFSKPFNSIPDMIHHYSRNKLPIKGAEHMSLLHPVIDQLL